MKCPKCYTEIIVTELSRHEREREIGEGLIVWLYVAAECPNCDYYIEGEIDDYSENLNG